MKRRDVEDKDTKLLPPHQSFYQKTSSRGDCAAVLFVQLQGTEALDTFRSYGTASQSLVLEKD